MESNKPEVRVRMLDGLVIECDGARRAYHSKAHQNWQVIAYLILNRGRAVPREELMALSPASAYSTDAPRMLRNRIFRIRHYLEPLSQAAGSDLILSGKTGIQWNPAVKLALDTDQFVADCNIVSKASLAEQYGRGFLPMFPALESYGAAVSEAYASAPESVENT